MWYNTDKFPCPAGNSRLPRRGRFSPFPGPAISFSDAFPPVALGSVVVSAIAFAVCFAYVEREEPLPVVSRTWERSIRIELNTLCTEEGWHVPHGGEVIDSWQAIYDYDQVCFGSGENEVCVSVPDYETRYRYKIWRWLYNRTESVSGADKDIPHWPIVQLAEKERMGYREDKYLVWCKNKDGKRISTPVTQHDYNLLEKGNTVLAVFNMFGGFRRVTLLENPA